MHGIHFLAEIVLLLTATVGFVLLFRTLKLGPIPAYLTAGALLGPTGLGAIGDSELITSMGEFGVVFLLFIIGLELSFERLKTMRRLVFGMGSAQMVITLAFGSILAALMGVEARATLIIAGGLALSSTAMVMQLLEERGERSSQAGRLSLAVLILQDLAVIPLLVMVPLLASGEGTLAGLLSEAIIKAVLAMLIIYVLGRRVLKPLFRVIAAQRNTEIFTATTLLVVLASALMSHAAGLSPALGAFMAGLLVAETEFRPQVEADITPFKSLFLGVFFVAVGMQLDLNVVAQHWQTVIGLTWLVLVGKGVMLYLLCRGARFSSGVSIHTALLLAQGGEFGFVLFALATNAGLLTPQQSALLTAVITLSMALTPLLGALGSSIAQKLDAGQQRRAQDAMAQTMDLSHHVIIAGFGRVGRTISRLLDNEHIPYVALDMDSATVMHARQNHQPVYFADASRGHVLKAVGLTRADAVVITHNDANAALQTVRTVRTIDTEVTIVVRARNLEQVKVLEDAGATLAIAEMFETSLNLGELLLREVGVQDNEVQRLLREFRESDYARLVGG